MWSTFEAVVCPSSVVVVGLSACSQGLWMCLVKWEGSKRPPAFLDVFAWLTVLDAGSFNVAEGSLADFNCVQQCDHIAFRIWWEVVEGTVAQSISKRNQGVKGFSGSWWCWWTPPLCWFYDSSPVQAPHLSVLCCRAWPGLGFWCAPPAWTSYPWRADLIQMATAGKAPDERLRIAFSNGFLSSKMFCCLIYDFFCNTEAWDEKAEGFLLFLSENSSHCCGFASSLVG